MISAEKIRSELQRKFAFKKTKGKWMQEGQCPDCNENELFCPSDEPTFVRCNRIDSCGYGESVRSILPHLFEDWSKQAPATDENPNATADAYLLHERGLELAGLKKAYRQELYRDYNSGLTSATVRFALPGGTYWERLIDRAGRFSSKARFESKGSWSGHCWMHPDISFADLAVMDEIWIAEGIFDAEALRLAFRGRDVKRATVSAMTCNTYPKHFLADLQKAIADGPSPKQQPKIVWAFDVGAAGVTYSRKFTARAETEGWNSTAVQVRPDGEGAKHDWNDLWLRHRDWKGDAEAAPLSETALEEFFHNGAITLATSAYEKAKLIFERAEAKALRLSSFDLRFQDKIYWAKKNYNEDDGSTIDVRRICNCAFRILYRERDDIADETSFFVQLDFPGKRKSEKARFSNAQIANNAEFKKRLLAFSAMWSGEQSQLDRIIERQTLGLKKIEPIAFTGYSLPHKAWVLGEMAVREGRYIPINKDRYFDLGSAAVKRASPQNLLDITYNPDNLDWSWLDDIWAAWGPQGLVAFAFFNMSLFAVQIRKAHASLGFLEITGEGGSGKTTLVTALWKAMGRAEYEGVDPNKGTAAYLGRVMMGVSNLPVGLIEGNRDDEKRNHAAKFDWAELLVLFNGRNPRGRAMKSMGNEIYDPDFLGSIYLMQNEPIVAMQPVLERIMTMEINKARWSDNTAIAAERIETMPMEKMSAAIIHAIKQEADYLPFFFDRFNHHRTTMKQRVSGLHNTRVIKNHAQLMAGIEALHHIFGIAQDRIEQTVKFAETMAINRQNTAGGDHPLIAEFWEKVDYLLHEEDDHRHAAGTSINQHTKPDKIAIRLTAFEARIGRAGLKPMDITALKRILKNSRSRKFIKNGAVTNPAGQSVNCWIFENADNNDRII